MNLIQDGAIVFTFQDAVEHLLDSHELDRSSLNQRNARRAVETVYRDVPNKHSWKYLERQMILNTVAPYSTGTIAYDHTGGANERQLTLSDGTWPTWAQFGRVVIGTTHYEVQSRVSDTVITLRELSNPGADLASGTTYRLYRSAYPLPPDVRKIHGVWDVDGQRQIPVVDAIDHQNMLALTFDTPGQARHFTIRGTGDYLGTKDLIFGPPPDQAYAFDVLYAARPRPIVIDRYQQGTVTTSSTAVAGTGTNFPINCVGSVIRFSQNKNTPNNVFGGEDLDNFVIHTAVITARANATTITISEAPDSTLTAVSYIISDPLDIDTNVMYTAFLKACEAEYASLAGRDDLARRMRIAAGEMLQAIENNDAAPYAPRRVMYDPFTAPVVSE